MRVQGYLVGGLSNWQNRTKTLGWHVSSNLILTTMIGNAYHFSHFIKKKEETLFKISRLIKGRTTVKIQTPWSSKRVRPTATLTPIMKGKLQAEWGSPRNHRATCEWRPVEQSKGFSDLSALICGFSCFAGDVSNENPFHYILSIHLSPNIT